uniref:Glycoside hydrolase family 28 protein n=2 Tax=Ignisphaera aggregans TaxID=334771 RepID=A0A7J3I7Q0_9CREN
MNPMWLIDTMGQRFNVVDFGADSKGGEDSSRAFNTAIEEASEKKGVVYIPPGEYLVTTILLKSNTVVFMERDAFIKFSSDFDRYPVIETRREGQHQCQTSPMIFGRDVRNVALIGEGVVDGQGQQWWYIKRSRVSEEMWKNIVDSGRGFIDEEQQIWWPSKRAFEGYKLYRELVAKGVKPTEDICKQYHEFFRPQLLQLYNAENVLISGVTFKNSPMWNVHLLYSQHVTVESILITAPDYSPNTDGIVVDSSSDVHIRGCFIDVGDDCVVIKSGKNEEGRRIGKPSMNIYVSSCTMRRGHGGFVIGSEMSGGVRNATIENCVFDGTERGVRIKTARGRGGIVENVIARNIVMRDIVYEAIVIDMFYEPLPPEPVSERTPAIRGVYMYNIVCDGAGQAVRLSGLPEMPIRDIVIENARIRARRGILLSNVTSARLSKIRISSLEGPVLVLDNTDGVTLDDFSSRAG